MKEKILERYDRTDDNRVIIDVSASKVEELYEDFDKQAPYHRKDLDEELASYLVDCVREIGAADFVIRITLDRPLSAELQARIRTSLYKFFMYQRELEVASVTRILKRSLMLLLAGFALLFLSFRLHGDSVRPFYQNVLIEGVTIAAWVSLWESLSIALFNWWPSHHRIRLNFRIANAEVLFHAQSSRL